MLNKSNDEELKQLTSDGHHSFRLLTAHEEDHIALGGVDIIVLQEEGLVNAILL